MACERRCGDEARDAARTAALALYGAACHAAGASFDAACPDRALRLQAASCPRCGDGKVTHGEKCDPQKEGGPTCLDQCTRIQL